MTTPRREAFSCSSFNYITFIEGRRSEKLKTLVQPSVRFPLLVAPLWRPPSPLSNSIQTPPHTHTHTLAPRSTLEVCAVSAWWADCVTFWHTHSPRAFLYRHHRWEAGRTCAHMYANYAYVQWHNSNTTEVDLNIYIQRCKAAIVR